MTTPLKRRSVALFTLAIRPLATLAVLALLGSSCSRQTALSSGQEREVTLSLRGDDAPRSPEGARVEADLSLTMSATMDVSGSTEDLDARLRAAARAWLQPALAAGLPAARTADPAPLRASLQSLGLALLTVRITRLQVEGTQRRDELAPTTDLEIMIIGLDAYDWDIADPLLAAGRLPVLQGLIERGTKARLQTIPPVLSPVIWTSMASSRHPQDHGILDFLGTDAKGNAVPVTSNLRRVKAFWNVLSEADVDTGVVGWWATWPAEPVRGFMVSDRVAYQLFHLDEKDLPTAGKVHPPSLWAELEPLVVKPRDIGPEDMRPFLSPAPGELDAQDRELLGQFQGILAQARTYAAIGLHLHETRKPRVAAYYFEAPDTACHLFMRYAPPPLPEIERARQQRYGAIVDRTYEYHDRILGRFLEKANDNTVVLVVSDHGFRSGAARPTRDSRVNTPTAADWHERMGMMVAAGPGIRKGHEIAEASILDVFPTMLALLGMPIAEDLAGRVWEDAFEPDFLRAHPLRSIPTFETGDAGSEQVFAETSPEDRAILEQLVAIGYVSPAALGGPASSTRDGQPGAPATGQAAANAFNNLGTILLQQGDLEAAEAEFRKVTELAPEFAPGHVNLAQALVRMGRSADAGTSLRRALQLDPANPRALALQASLHLSSGLRAEAEAMARAAVERDPRSSAGWFTLGQVLEASARATEARAAYAKSSEFDPDNPEPLNAMGNSFEASGDWASAATHYEKALKTDPTFAAAYNNLALQQQRMGQRAQALATYEEGRRRLPNSSILLNNLATWHHLEAQELLARVRETGGGDATASTGARAAGEAAARRAESLYREAMEANALDASPWNNLGALQGELGLAEEQFRNYSRAVEIDPQYADAWHNIGLWHSQRSAWKEAHEAFARALAARPSLEQSLQMNALALVRLGRSAEARQQLEAALTPRPSPALLATLGSVLEAEGRRDDACLRFREALRLAPQATDLRQRVEATCGR